MRSPLLLLLLLLITVTTNATNYYVDASTTSSTQNGSAANPWKTLSQVSSNLSSIMPGDIVSFKRGGTYPGQLIIDRSGTAGNPITFNAYGTGAAPIFSGTGSPITYLFYIYNRAYITFDGLNVTDPALSLTDHTQMARIQRAFYVDGTTNNVIIKKCSVSLAGIGVYLVGPNNTIDSCVIQNLRMVVNTAGGYDDYGANAVLVSSSNNRITNNQFLDCWAPSYDFQYDGGALEIYGTSVNNNFIGYNTMVNNCGLVEIASGNWGTCTGTIFAYNKLINNSSIFFIHNQTMDVSNLQFYNNVIIETLVQRVYDNYIAAMYSTSTATGIVVMKNNIFWLSTGIDVARSNQFTSGQLIHEDNIYRLGTNSVLNFTQNASEMVTTATNIFTNTSATDPASWNLTPVSTGPAIDFGQNVGLTKDFAGNTVPSVPNAGLFESAAAQTPALTVNATSGTIACNGGTTTITVTASGGTAPYTGTGTYTVAAGTYTYNVTDAAGATGSKTLAVTQPTALNASLTTGVISAFGGTTSVTVAASGGSGTYTYKLNSGAYQASTTFSGITAGAHTITVKDASGCTITKNVTLTQPGSASMVVTATPVAINCNGATTTVTVSATGGTAPYTGTGTFTVSAGTYSYTVTDAAFSVKSTSVTVSQPAAIAATATAGTIAAYGGTTSITVSGVSGGTSPYTYKLNSGAYQSSAVFAGVAAGNHTVTIKDAKGCTLAKSVTITQPASTLQIATSAGTIACNNGTTTVTVSGSGGTTPYTGTGTFIVSAGTYTYTITDAAGASKSATVTVTQPQAITATVTAGTVTSAVGTTTATVSATGGTPGYTYKLNSGAYQSSASFTNVPVGNHTITVKDTRGCTGTKSFTVAAPAALQIILVAKSDNSCRYTWDGSITVAATGGTAPYSYQISSYGYGPTSTFINLGPNTYTVSAKDATGAISSMQVTILASNAVCAAKIAGKGNNNEKPASEINDALRIKAYPNPTSDVFYLEIKNSEATTSTISIMNLDGKIVEQTRVTGNRKIALGKSLAAGAYIVRVQDGKKVQSTQIVKY